MWKFEPHLSVVWREVGTTSVELVLSDFSPWPSLHVLWGGSSMRFSRPVRWVFNNALRMWEKEGFGVKLGRNHFLFPANKISLPSIFAGSTSRGSANLGWKILGWGMNSRKFHKAELEFECFILKVYHFYSLYKKFYLSKNHFFFWVVLVLHSALRAFCAVSGDSSSLWCMDFSLRWVLLLQSTSCPRHVESSWTKDQTHVPCISRQILIRCTTREICECITFNLKKI